MYRNISTHFILLLNTCRISSFIRKYFKHFKKIETFNFIHIMAACIIYSGHGHKHLDIKIIIANARIFLKLNCHQTYACKYL